MEEVRDIQGRLVCYCNGSTGELKSVYKRQSVYAMIPVGGSIAFVREGIVTHISRRTAHQFYVFSQQHQKEA